MAARKQPPKAKAKAKRSASRSAASQPHRRSLLWRFRRSLFLAALVMITGVAGAGFVLAQVALPPEDPSLQSTFICASDVSADCGPDNAIAKLAGEEDRVSVPLEEIPQTFIDAVLAAEDRQFFSHNGIDPLGIGRALYRDVRNQGARQGGSTITQQYAKNEFLSSERTLTRKLKEAVLAVKLERELSKEQILQRYLNTVYFGRGAYGADAAARAYFGHSIRNVDLSQAAYLAGLIRAPESADVSRNADTAIFRRDSVLAGMLAEGMITRGEHDAAKGVELTATVSERTVREGLGDVVGTEHGTEYYVEYVRRLLSRKYGDEVVYGGGLRVYTALDMDLQRTAYESVYGTLDQEGDPAGALVSVDELGRVVALVGGRDFDASEVNLALGAGAGGSGRQPGSAFKPIVLATAIEQDISVRSKFRNENDIVLPEANNGEDWEVSNYAEGSEEIVDLVEATKVSSNTIYARLMLEVGPANVKEMAHELGITADIPAVNALTLGSGEVSVLDMASAYSTFARRGKALDPIIITRVEQVVDGEVRVLEEFDDDGEQVMDPTSADSVNWILRQVILGGTGQAADFGAVAAGKTGTTQDHRDAWFVGYTPRLTTAVWMGYPDLTVDDPATADDEGGKPRFMTDVRGRRVTGGSFPADIWRTFMSRALEGVDHGSFVPPPPFGGTTLNADLTTTTEPPEDDEDESTTTTTLPLCEPDEDPTESCRTTTTTTAAEDQEGEDDEDDETTSTTTSSSTSAPPTTAAPTTTTGSTTTTTTSTIPDIGD